MTQPIFSTQDLCKSFGKLQAVDDVSIDLYGREIKGMIGPNGSGKTTFINIVTGLYSCDAGSILFNGKSINKLTSYQRASKGIGRTFQITRLFRKMTVLENMLVGGYVSEYSDIAEINERAMGLLKLVGLTKLVHERAQNLSGGQQKLLELARTIMTRPDLLLADEPFAGVNPAIKQRLFDVLRKLNVEEGLTCLVVSHDLPSIVELCEKTVVLSAGKKIVEGKTKEILEDARVVEAYLGGQRAGNK